jgi:hypothetical protein
MANALLARISLSGGMAQVGGDCGVVAVTPGGTCGALVAMGGVVEWSEAAWWLAWPAPWGGDAKVVFKRAVWRKGVMPGGRVISGCLLCLAL